MSVLRRLIPLLLLLTLSVAVSGEPVWEQFTTEDGLISNDVYAFFEASDGSVWIGTHGDGLNQYVGGEMLTWNSGSDWIPNIVYDICDDAEGRIWASSLDYGCVVLESGSWEAGFYLEHPFWWIYAQGGIERGADGRLWGGFFAGIMWHDPMSGAGGEVWSAPPYSYQGGKDPQPRNLFIDSTGAIWFKSNWEMIKMDQDGNIIRTFPGRFGGIIEAPDRTIWLGRWYNNKYSIDWSGVDRLEGDEFVSVSPPAGSFPAEPMGPICATNSGEIVTGCYNWDSDSRGVFIYDGAEWEYWEAPFDSPHEPIPIREVMVDRHGDIWVGTARIDSGVWVLRRNQGQSDVVVGLSANASECAAGDTMKVFLDVTSAQSKTVDLYVAIQLPSGYVVFYPSLGMSWSAYWPGLLLPAGTDVEDHELFSLTLSELPAGTYRWFAACTDAGTMEYASNIASCEWEFVR